MRKGAHQLGSTQTFDFTCIITFSGAHGVGKSTIIEDLKQRCANPQQRVYVLPSISTFWFKNCQVQAEAAGLEVPKTYDDINRLGYRERMQREMPQILANKLVVEVERAIDLGGGIILVDRWFSDILAYTAIELPEIADEMAGQAHVIYNRMLADLNRQANKYKGSLYLTHVFIPASSCAHETPRGATAEKAHRGTQPVDLWESAYARFNRFTDDKRTLVITTSDRPKRVGEILAGCL